MNSMTAVTLSQMAPCNKINTSKYPATVLRTQCCDFYLALLSDSRNKEMWQHKMFVCCHSDGKSIFPKHREHDTLTKLFIKDVTIKNPTQMCDRYLNVKFAKSSSKSAENQQHVSSHLRLLLESTAADIQQKVSRLFDSKHHIHTLFPWRRPPSGEQIGLKPSGGTYEGKKTSNPKKDFYELNFLTVIEHSAWLNEKKTDWALIQIIPTINVNAASIKCTSHYLKQWLKPILLDLSPLKSACKWTFYETIS